MKKFTGILPVLMSALAMLCAPDASASPPRHPGPVVLHAGFHLVGSAEAVLSSGRHVVLIHSSGASIGTLIDEQTGRRSTVPAARCRFRTGAPLLGGGWLLVNCSSSLSQNLELYRVPSGPWRGFTPAAGIQQWCQAAGMSTCAPIAVGTDWIKFDETCYHCLHTYVYQSIETGQLRSDPTNPSTLADLDSSSLTRKVCAPARIPPAGRLAFFGRFAIATGSGAFLERCGSRLHERIDAVDNPIAANSHAILWQSLNAHVLDGVLLPSTRPLLIRLPTRFGQPSAIALGSDRLYVLVNGKVWGAPSASQSRLPARKTHK